jgi:hypothetical protein
VDGTARRANNDYVYADRTAKLRSSGSVSVSVVGDRRAEAPELFRVRPYKVSGGTIASSPGLVVVVDNDTR